MSDFRCPDCGAPVSPSAVVCPSCGFPIRPNAPHGHAGQPGAPRSGSRRLIIALFVVGCVMLLGVGTFWVLAMPRLTRWTNRVNEQQGEMLLRWAYSAEEIYREEHGSYAADPDQLPSQGRLDRQPFALYGLEISNAGESELCLEAVPRPGPGKKLRHLSMDAEGDLYRAAGCSGQPEPVAGAPDAGDPPSSAAAADSAFDVPEASDSKPFEKP